MYDGAFTRKRRGGERDVLATVVDGLRKGSGCLEWEPRSPEEWSGRSDAGACSLMGVF